MHDEINDEEELEQPRKKHRILHFVALKGAVLFVTAQMSLHTVPGDFLYPMKRAIERVKTHAIVNDVSRIRMYFELEQEKLSEAERLIERNENVERVAEALRMADEYRQRAMDLVDEAEERHGGLDEISAFF